MSPFQIIHDIMSEHRTELINVNQIPIKNGYRCGEGWLVLYHAFQYLTDQSKFERDEEYRLRQAITQQINKMKVKELQKVAEICQKLTI